jgi:hypothetical protein
MRILIIPLCLLLLTGCTITAAGFGANYLGIAAANRPMPEAGQLKQAR